MNDELINKRKYYFGFLFSSIIFFPILIILKVKLDLNVDPIPIFSITLLSFLPAFLYFNKKKYNYKNLLIISYIPVIVGFLLSIIFNNSMYMVISFPLFLLNYIILVPR